MPALVQRAFCEWLGTAFLLAAVVGSGIMAQKLAGDDAIALLCNTLPTGTILVVLILVFGPLSGAHFNPAVSIAFALRSELPWSEAGIYIAAQVLGGLVGVWIAHLMFELPVWQFSINERTGPGQWLAEAVATFGLLLTIFGCVSRRPDSVPYAVGLYITAAYWFTASTSFANPAVHDCAVAFRHVFGDSAHRRGGLHCLPARRNGRRSRAESLALAQANDRLG
jgi:glycerol uptake facilitator-like aquaporin